MLCKCGSCPKWAFKHEQARECPQVEDEVRPIKRFRSEVVKKTKRRKKKSQFNPSHMYVHADLEAGQGCRFGGLF